MFRRDFARSNGLAAAALALTFASALMVGGSAASSAFAAEPLRVCADPDNLPFSRAEGAERGLYVELAELVGAKLAFMLFYWCYTRRM